MVNAGTGPELGRNRAGTSATSPDAACGQASGILKEGSPRLDLAEVGC